MMSSAKPPSIASAPRIQTLGLIAAAYAVFGTLTEAIFPPVSALSISPIDVFLWISIAVALAVTSLEALQCWQRGRFNGYWSLALGAICAVALLQFEDAAADSFLRETQGQAGDLEYIANAAVGVIVAAGLMVLYRFSIRNVWISRALIATVAFQVFALASEFLEVRSFITSAAVSRDVMLSAQLAQLLCIEFFVAAIALTGLRVTAEADRAALPAVLSRMPVTAVGSRMREVFRHGGLKWRPSHPPVKFAFYPVFRELTVGLAAGWLAWKAGPGVQAATGKPVWRQGLEMMALWFGNGMDPPSYYAQELYRPSHRNAVAEYLTRYETKNGLLGALNRMRPSPFASSEMNCKALFYDYCQRCGLAHPQVLAAVDGQGPVLLVPRERLETDLFCKPQKGMGAFGTISFRHEGPDRFVDEEGLPHSLDDAMAHVAQKSDGKRMLVQAWLKNHPDIADFAKDSLVTFRVVTCRNERGEGEVVLAMLRVLAKLEPGWPEALDEEYAAPINLASGKLGLFTGDNMTTSPLRYVRHPLTGAQVEGRVISQWPAIRDLALAAHHAFDHRVLVGWDIGLTPEGAVLLEGNTNLDVMFLQRVHDLPAGRTRLGVLLSYQLDQLVASLPETHQAMG